jgi:hypothetical protein
MYFLLPWIKRQQKMSFHGGAGYKISQTGSKLKSYHPALSNPATPHQRRAIQDC